MAKLTGRDYKGSQRRALKVRGLREFAYGVIAGVLLASVAFAYVYSRVHRSADAGDTPQPDPHRAARADA